LCITLLTRRRLTVDVALERRVSRLAGRGFIADGGVGVLLCRGERIRIDRGIGVRLRRRERLGC